MKKLKKILIILSLSFYLTAVLTPKEEEKAEAIALSGMIALGALAITAVGGAFAYYNQSTVQEIGSIAYNKATDAGINVSDMIAQNQFGMNKELTRKLAESIEEVNSRVLNVKDGTYSISVNPGTSELIHLPQTFLDLAAQSKTLAFDIEYSSTESTNYFGFGIGDISPQYLTATRNILRVSQKIQLGTNHYRLEYNDEGGRVTERRNELLEKGYIKLQVYSAASAPVFITLTPYQYNHSNERIQATHMNGVQNLGSVAEYQSAIDSLYNNSTVSVDYERIEQIMENSASEPINLTNIENMVSGIQDSIEDGSEAQVGILTTIWNGIKNIPNLMQSTSTAILGGISSLGDNLMNGIDNAIDNLTSTTERLWEDAGIVWDGMTNAINNVRTGIIDALSPVLTGIEQGLSDLGSRLIDLGLGILEIPVAIGTAISRAFTNAFTVPENYFTSRINTIENILAPKLPKFPDKEALFPSDFNEMGDWPGITADFEHYGIGTQMVIDNQAPNYYRRQIKLWISAILYFFTALFVIRKIAGVINK